MTLNRGNLGFTNVITNGATSSVYTVGSAQTAYVKSILIHNLSTTSIQNTQVHFVPNVGGSAGTAGTLTQIARIGISTNDTFFFEPAYPLTLTSTGDSIQITNEGTATSSLNVVVLGDKEV